MVSVILESWCNLFWDNGKLLRKDMFNFGHTKRTNVLWANEFKQEQHLKFVFFVRKDQPKQNNSLQEKVKYTFSAASQIGLPRQYWVRKRFGLQQEKNPSSLC